MKAYKFKLKSNKKFAEAAERVLNTCRELYNAGLQERRDAYQFGCISLNYHSQAIQLPDIKETRPDVKEIYSQVLQDVLRRLDKAFDNFFRRVKTGEKPGYPRFKSKDRYDSFTYPQSGFRVEGDKLHLSKLGSCRFRLSRPIEGTIKTCTIKRECDGWYVIFTVEPNQCRHIPKTGKKVGVDVGLTHFATLSTGEKIENPRFFRKTADDLAKAQRKLQTKERGSNKRKAAKKVVRQLHCKIANQRKDFAHKTANGLLKRFDEIHIEDLNIKGMVKNSHLSKSISDVGWGIFFSVATYKAADAGKKVVRKIPSGTSQTCCECGHRLEVKLKLSERVFVCPQCDNIKDRDHNSGINILNGRASRRERNLSESPSIAGLPV